MGSRVSRGVRQRVVWRGVKIQSSLRDLVFYAVRFPGIPLALFCMSGFESSNPETRRVKYNRRSAALDVPLGRICGRKAGHSPPVGVNFDGVARRRYLRGASGGLRGL